MKNKDIMRNVTEWRKKNGRLGNPNVNQFGNMGFGLVVNNSPVLGKKYPKSTAFSEWIELPFNENR